MLQMLDSRSFFSAATPRFEITPEGDPGSYHVNPSNNDMSLVRDSDQRVCIVLVDDNPADVLLVREALAWHEVKPNLVVARDGDEAITLLEEIERFQRPCPGLVVLDLNLPRRTGFDVLERMRESPRCGKMPIAILSSSDAPSDRLKAELLGASKYFQKPSNLQDFMTIGARLKEMLA